MTLSFDYKTIGATASPSYWRNDLRFWTAQAGDGGTGGTFKGESILKLYSTGGAWQTNTRTYTVPAGAAYADIRFTNRNFDTTFYGTTRVDNVVLTGFMASAVTLYYGKHQPHGVDAVNYMWGSNGTWVDVDTIDYTYNYYSQWAHSGHPYNRNALINEAQTLGYHRTCQDIDGHLLMDFNKDLEIDQHTGDAAYYEHNGRGTSGEVRTNPLKLYWFDDNWLAREMCEAYGQSPPYGLYDSGGQIRWSSVDGTTSRYSLSGSNTYVDLICLDGLYYLGLNQTSNAVGRYKKARDVLSPVWNSNDQRYDYGSQAGENYKLGLFAMLAAQIMEKSDVGSSDQIDARQHYISARSHILSRQEMSGSTRLSWKAALGIHDLMNTETVSCCSLGLGSDARYGAYEAGVSPMLNDNNNYFYRPHKVLSAVTGLSTAGYMCYGPYHTFDSGTKQARFYMRAPSPIGTMAYLEVHNSTDNTVLASKSVSASEFASSNKWTVFKLNFSLRSSKSLEFRVYWYGTANMDVSAIRIDD